MSTTRLADPVRRAAREARSRWRRQRVVEVALPGGGRLRWRHDDRYPAAMATGTYEPELVARLVEHVRRGDHVLDLGANSGYLSFVAKALAGPAGRIVAVEPHPDNLATIADRQALNPDLPLEVVAGAVAARTGRATLQLTRNLANSRLGDPAWSHAKPAIAALEVATHSLDDLVRRTAPTLVKLDIEGAEGEVLEASAGPSAWPTVPMLLVEYHGGDNRDRVRAVARDWGWVAADAPSPDGLPAGLLTVQRPGTSQERGT